MLCASSCCCSPNDLVISVPFFQARSADLAARSTQLGVAMEPLLSPQAIAEDVHHLHHGTSGGHGERGGEASAGNLSSSSSDDRDNLNAPSDDGNSSDDGYAPCLSGPGDSAWKSNSDQKACAQCSSAFNLLKRRHHCRICGNLFCSACCILRSFRASDYRSDAPTDVLNARRNAIMCSACYTQCEHELS